MDVLTPGQQLLEDGLARLRDLLGGTWTIELNAGADSLAPNMRGRSPDLAADALVHMYQQTGGFSTRILVEARTDLRPAEVERELLPKLRLLQQVQGEAPALVIAPWISPRSRDLLADWGVGYLDLTGNVQLRLPRSGVVILTHGESRDPNPSTTTNRQVKGIRAGRLVRLLVDVAPPYRTTELAEVSGISVPYASRLLTSMEDMALIRRDGPLIIDVDWRNLLRTRAEERTLLSSSFAEGALALNGVDFALDRLRGELPNLDRVAVTGSLAAAHVAPLAVGGQLMIYIAPKLQVDRLTKSLGLVRADQAADVLLLRPRDVVVFERCRIVNGLPHVALSQLAIDCLGGPGRLPEAGEAILERMASDQTDWRLRNLEQVTPMKP